MILQESPRENNTATEQKDKDEDDNRGLRSAAQSQLYRELWTLTYSTKQLVT